MRAFLIGFSAAILFAVANAAFYKFTGEGSFLFVGFFGVIPFDWGMIGIYMAMAIGLTHRGLNAGDGAELFFAGAISALLCTLLTHILQCFAILDRWDGHAFITYLDVYGKSWGVGGWYIWLAAVLATLTGGFGAVGLASVQRADNIRAQLPAWVSPTTRILIHVARADGTVTNEEAIVITRLLSAQMQRTLPTVPLDFDTALSDVINAEVEAIRSGLTLKQDLKSKCFKSQEQRECTLRLAIAVAQADGVVSDSEAKVLDELFAAWNVDFARRSEFAAGATREFTLAIS